MLGQKKGQIPVKAGRSAPQVGSRYQMFPRVPMWLRDFDMDNSLWDEFLTFPTMMRGGGQIVPEIDLFETNGDVVVKAAIPGMEAKDIKVQCNEGILNLSGEYKKEEETKEKAFYRREISSGEFHRQIAMPTEVIADKAKATYKNGVLEIHLPKAEKGKPNAVRVPVEGS